MGMTCDTCHGSVTVTYEKKGGWVWRITNCLCGRTEQMLIEQPHDMGGHETDEDQR